MSWIGLLDRKLRRYHPAGLGADTPSPHAAGDRVPTGTLLLEAEVRPGRGRQVLLRCLAGHPGGTATELSLDDDGRLRLFQVRNDQVRAYELATGQVSRTHTMRVAVIWQGAQGTAVLDATVSDTGRRWSRICDDILIPSRRDLRNLIARTDLPGLTRYIALADHAMPIAAVPLLTVGTPILTPDGPRPLGRLRAGDQVQVPGGGTAQVRWIGQTSLPARGGFAPVRVRAPYHGATSDILCAAEARVHLIGSTIDYLFDRDCVSVAAQDLHQGVDRLTEPPDVVTYAQVLLDRPCAMDAMGLGLEGLQMPAGPRGRLSGLPDLLSDWPAELLPRSGAGTITRLTRAEAFALGQSHAA